MRSSRNKAKDYCSFAPDWGVAKCCKKHDKAYKERPLRSWKRLKADLDFFDCIWCKGRYLTACVYYLAVRWFGFWWHTIKHGK